MRRTTALMRVDGRWSWKETLIEFEWPPLKIRNVLCSVLDKMKGTKLPT